MQISEKILQAARGGWPHVLGALGVRSDMLQDQHGPCPGCGGRDRFRFDDKDGDGTFICSQGGGGVLSGNGIELLMHCKGLSWVEALKVLAKHLGIEGEKGGSVPSARAWKPQPKREEVKKRQEFDPAALEAAARDVAGTFGDSFAAGVRVLLQRSPVWPLGLSPEDFLRAIYNDGEKCLVFTNERSRSGQYGVRMDAGGGVTVLRLGRRPLAKNERVEVLPRGGRCGVWFLAQPVDGEWRLTGRTDKEGNPVHSRRSKENVTDWRFFVLESDDADPGKWLSLLLTLPLPVVAIYSSGGKSVHALLDTGARSKAEWDALRDRLSPVLTRLGGDAGAMTAVRLTRLPNVLRFGKEGKDGYVEYARPAMQQLFFLNPRPEMVPVSQFPKRWSF
jgi:hypothetical protein